LTKGVNYQLNPTKLYKTFDTKPQNLSLQSKCNGLPTIKLVNAETRDENYNVNGPLNNWHIIPSELTGIIVDYMKDALDKSQVKIHDNSTKVIQVSFVELELNSGFLHSAEIRLKIDIPEIHYTKIFEGEERVALTVYHGIAYAIHVVTWKIINDPVIQNYILCKKTALSEESPVRESALDILKRRYVSGEITKEQFEQMKKDIQ